MNRRIECTVRFWDILHVPLNRVIRGYYYLNVHHQGILLLERSCFRYKHRHREPETLARSYPWTSGSGCGVRV